jgi:teichuronic acid exporter
MDVVGKILSGARWLGAARLVTQVYSWAITILVMRLLTPNDYALMTMASVVFSFVAQFQELGVRVKLVQMKEYTREYARSVYGLVLVSNSTIFLGLLLVSPLIADFFRQDALVAIVAALALSMLITSVGSIPDALLNRQLEFRKLAIIDMVAVVTSVTLTLVLAWAGVGVWSLVYGSLFRAVVRAVGLSAASPFRDWPSFDFAGLGDTLRFGGTVVLQRFVWWFYVSLDSLLIGRFYPAHSLGIYATAGELAKLPLEKVGSIIGTLSFAGLSRVAQDMATFRHYLLRALKLVSLVMFPAFLGIAAIAAEFVPAVLGDKWEGLAPILALIALSAPGRSMNELTAGALNSLGKPQLQLKCLVVAAVLTAIGIVSGMPFGLEEIAIGLALSSTIACFYTFWVVSGQAGLRVSDLLGALWQPACASLTMAAVLFGLRPLLPIEFPSLLGLVTTIVLGAIVYCGVIAVIDRDAFRLVRSVVWKRQSSA